FIRLTVTTLPSYTGKFKEGSIYVHSDNAGKLDVPEVSTEVANNPVNQVIRWFQNILKVNGSAIQGAPPDALQTDIATLNNNSLVTAYAGADVLTLRNGNAVVP